MSPSTSADDGQETIPVGDPEAKLDGETCEWCEDDAKVAVEIKRKIKGQRGGVVGTGTYIYACWDHHEQARGVVRAKLETGRVGL